MVALLLTGMGADGADGMVELRQRGAETIAEARAVVRRVRHAASEAIARGGAVHIASLLAIPDLVVRLSHAPELRQPRELN